jgi:hypothetical protein
VGLPSVALNFYAHQIVEVFYEENRWKVSQRTPPISLTKTFISVETCESSGRLDDAILGLPHRVLYLLNDVHQLDCR